MTIRQTVLLVLTLLQLAGCNLDRVIGPPAPTVEQIK